MEMEQLEAAIYNWPLAPYDNKLDVDANFKRMVDFGMKPENINAVHLGIGSHNLFELTYAFKLAQKYEVTEYFSFEMLTSVITNLNHHLSPSRFCSGESAGASPVNAMPSRVTKAPSIT